jgi:hypothetical protein
LILVTIYDNMIVVKILICYFNKLVKFL